MYATKGWILHTSAMVMMMRPHSNWRHCDCYWQLLMRVATPPPTAATSWVIASHPHCAIDDNIIFRSLIIHVALLMGSSINISTSITILPWKFEAKNTVCKASIKSNCLQSNSINDVIHVPSANVDPQITANRTRWNIIYLVHIDNKETRIQSATLSCKMRLTRICLESWRCYCNIWFIPYFLPLWGAVYWFKHNT